MFNTVRIIDMITVINGIPVKNSLSTYLNYSFLATNKDNLVTINSKGLSNYCYY